MGGFFVLKCISLYKKKSQCLNITTHITEEVAME
jgi:hypothetical protein